MNITKDNILLDVAGDLISEVITNICNSTTISNKEELSNEALYILRRICLLDERLKEQY